MIGVQIDPDWFDEQQLMHIAHGDFPPGTDYVPAPSGTERAWAFVLA